MEMTLEDLGKTLTADPNEVQQNENRVLIFGLYFTPAKFENLWLVKMESKIDF